MGQNLQKGKISKIVEKTEDKRNRTQFKGKKLVKIKTTNQKVIIECNFQTKN